MDFLSRLTSRPPQRNLPAEGRSPFQQDADRIVFSSAFRRLQNKTQVHPLPHTDFVRTRLTHSMEVASVGRSLGGLVARQLLAGDAALSRSQPHLAADLGDIVAAACLAHDIGNPPFGHAGEEAMQTWFGAAGAVLDDGLTAAERADFLRFEGNAQGFRILTQLQMDRYDGGMRLMDATLAAFSKYPCGAGAAEGRAAAYIGRKKHGFMQAEAAIFAELAGRLGLAPLAGAAQAYYRHPFTYLVEAADDICYSVIDVEDGVKLGRIGFSEAEALFREIIGQPLGDRYERRSNDEKLSTLRSRAIGSLIDACGAAFVGPARDFLAGHAPMALIDATPQAAVAVQLKRLALTRVYRWDRTVTEELKGISVIHRLLDLFVPAAVAVKRNAVVSRLCALVPHFNPGASRYERLLSVTDYISGMTDRYAMDMHERLGDVSL